MKSVYYGMFAFALISTASVLYANELKDACYSLSSWLTKSWDRQGFETAALSIRHDLAGRAMVRGLLPISRK